LKLPALRWILALIFAALVVSIAISSSSLHRSSAPPTGSVRAAAIIDGLAEHLPNDRFIEEASSLLREGGFDVHVYSGRAVTVELFKNLPSTYAIILLRTHGAPDAVFTAEPYDMNRFVYEQLADEVVGGEVAYLPKDRNRFFALPPKFVRDYMSFNGTVIIQMGCWGISRENDMANAFLEKGADLYISWDNWVTIERTDAATVELLRGLIVERDTISDAVDKAMRAVGPDFTYGSFLRYYPSWCGDKTLDEPCPNPFTEMSVGGSAWPGQECFENTGIRNEAEMRTLEGDDGARIQLIISEMPGP